MTADTLIDGIPVDTSEYPEWKQSGGNTSISGTRIISLSGLAGAGKDTVGRILVEKRGYERLAFADAVRSAVQIIDPFIPEPVSPPRGTTTRLSTILDLIGWEEAKRSYPEVRRLLQVMGTEVGREIIDQNVWVNIIVRRIRENPDQRYVITDTRFMNEFNALKGLGGLMTWVARPEVQPIVDHISEASLGGAKFDYLIYNATTLEDLERLTLAMADAVE